MKNYNAKFLAKANIAGNTKSKAIIIIIAIFVISVTLFTSYGTTLTSGVTEFKHDYKSLSVEITPFKKKLDESVINTIKDMDHVHNVFDYKNFLYEDFDICSIDSKKAPSNWSVYAYSLIGDEKRNVVAGKNLDESPTYSCIIPSMFCPYEDDLDSYKNVDIDPKSLIGKTFTISASDRFELLYNFKDEYGGISNKFFYSPPLKFNLKIVGVYYSPPTTYIGLDSIYISEATADDITKRELEAADIDLSSKTNPISIWWNNKKLRNHYIILDDYDSFPEVYNKVSDLGVDCTEVRDMEIYESIPIMASILSFSSVYLSAALIIICIIIIIQSNMDTIIKRKGELGLLKAIGYRNRDIFKFLFYEHLSLTIKGFLIGGVLSTATILTLNLVFSNKDDYGYLMYVVDWKLFAVLILIALIISIIIPLICQIFMLKKLNKIQPKDAMNSR